MAAKKSSIFAFMVLITGLIMLALPEKGFSGIGPVPITCCQGEGTCEDSTEGPFLCPVQDVVDDAFCDDSIGLCVPTGATADNIPTLSEWGLIAMAGLIGIAGFLVIRRKRAAA